MTNSIGHRVIAISRIFLNDQWKFLPWWLLSKSEYNENLHNGRWRLLKIPTGCIENAKHLYVINGLFLSNGFDEEITTFKENLVL